eukprot:TRINITY_DN11770_c0_g1_i1.p1 TRINITY_DN11770_c0_g1~~TRINITY_DN11770_c0_g1_i1.p1  ORF type:complete len:219 (-),score=47.57 TRINITY_DN11770_c0_g1_i1:98-754(-)
MAQFRELGKKIIAIGRNYAAHAKELNNELPKKPFFFLKPTTSYLSQGNSIEYPPQCKELSHEVELGVVIGKKGRDISSSSAMDYVAGYTLALDMTARDIQMEAKSKGLPWSEAKGYDTFCPVGDFIGKDKIKDPHNLGLWLKVDDKVRQKGNTSDMIFKIPTLIEHVSSIMTLEEGDLILTGTPEGVGPVLPGQVITAGLEDLLQIKFPIIAKPNSRS